MLNLLSLIVLLIAGILLGFVLRERKRVSLDKVTFTAIMALIFSLGFSIGSNNELLGSMPRVGLNAFIISVLTILFSIAFLKAAMKAVRMK